jgi:hypothetical protein
MNIDGPDLASPANTRLVWLTVTGGRMVYLGGPSGPRRRRGLYLHDPPPGYRPPKQRIPEEEQRRRVGRDRVLIQAATVVLVITATAFLALIIVLIAR